MLTHRFIDSINQIPESLWNKINNGNVFTSYAWLSALESSQCVHESTGWQPYHLIIEQGDKVIAIVPGYLKTHSYGEYVFDWSWAEAYHQHQVPYYPKWLSGVPFTPVQGARILTQAPCEVLFEYIYNALNMLMERRLSGCHINFLDKPDCWPSSQWAHRTGVQFHFFNEGYQSFNDFLETITSRKRKMIRKERQKAQAEDLQIKWCNGSEISASQLDAFVACYQSTYLKRSGHSGYLNHDFFKALLASMPQHMQICFAYHQDSIVAASLYLIDDKVLYGRYWGALEDFNFLHFELCYYQGMEFCIQHKLHHFDAGAQGEHKLVRGFKPIWTHSLHLIEHPSFAPAIADFCERERMHMQQYYQDCVAQLPFKA